MRDQCRGNLVVITAVSVVGNNTVDLMAFDNGLCQIMLGPHRAQHPRTVFQHIERHVLTLILDAICRQLQYHLIRQFLAEHGKRFTIRRTQHLVAECGVFSNQGE